MRHRQIFCILFACSVPVVVLACFLIQPARAEEEVKYVDVIERGAFFRSKHFAPVYDKRISNIREQIEMAVNKGWMGSDEGERLKSDCSRLQSTASGMGSEPVQSAVDEMERSLTRLNSDVQQAMKGSSPAPAPVAAAPTSASPQSTAPSSIPASSGSGASSSSSTNDSFSSGSGSTTSSTPASAADSSSTSTTGSTYGMGASAAGVVPMKSMTAKKASPAQKAK